MTIAIGQRIPAVTFRRMLADGTAVDLSTSEIFAGKKVVLFGLPGAFTPTCHKEHLPSYIARAGELAAKGIDGVVCMAVNDHWVMRAWADATGAEGKVDMLPDGNGELTRAMGLEADMSRSNLGQRCRRFVAVLEDGVVTSLELEPGRGIAATGAEACLLGL